MTHKNPRVAVVTGATGAIGKAIAQALHEQGMTVVLACRDAAKGARAAAEIGKRARVEVVDVARPGSIRAFAERFTGPLHVLVNNAADTPRRRTVTPEGIETQLATNVLGYLWMTEALSPALERGAPSRVVMVASYWAGGLDVGDLQFERRPYDNGAAYRQSKQANRMLAVALAERLREARIDVNACHPGDVNSALSNSLGFGGSDSPAEGAQTPVLLATDPTLAGVTGGYFEHGKVTLDPFARDPAAVEALYEALSSFPH